MYKDKNKLREYQRNYQRKWLDDRRKAWLSENGPCQKCGSWDALEVDHIDPNTKDPILKKWRTGCLWSWSLKRQEVELAKCQVLCHDCHLEKTISSYIPTPVIHGANGYHRGCKCDECRKYQRDRMNKYHLEHPRKRNAAIVQLAERDVANVEVPRS